MDTRLNFENLPRAIGDLSLKVDRISRQLDEMANRTGVTAFPDLMNVKQAAELLHTTTGYIYGLKHEGKIPYHKKPGGRGLYFLKDELLDWVTKQKGGYNG